jgi:hypothetical protein
LVDAWVLNELSNVKSKVNLEKSAAGLYTGTTAACVLQK